MSTPDAPNTSRESWRARLSSADANRRRGPNPPRSVIIGDVHGCISELQALLEACQISDEDELVFVGDLVAKGPASGAVVRLVRSLGAHSVKGNHEAVLLRYREAHAADADTGAFKQTHVESAAQMHPEDWEWLASLPTWFRLRNAEGLVVHAGMVPGVPVEQQRERDLLTMRTLREDGSATSRLDGGPSWAERWRGPEFVIFGHNAVVGLQRHRWAMGLDTGCVYGRELTALILPEQRLVSVTADRVHRSIGG